MSNKLDGPGLAALSVGIIFMWGGVKGYSPLVAFQNIIKGKNPNEGQAANSLVSANTSSGTSGGSGVTTGAGTYSYSQLQNVWTSNGGSSSAAPMAAAIAMAESGGKSNSSNSNTNGTTDRGLWQINSIWGALSTFDVNANAKAAIQISKNGTDWSPWVTYNTGAYKQFLK